MIDPGRRAKSLLSPEEQAPSPRERRLPVPATLYRVASKEVDAKGLADLALAEVV